MRAFICNKIKTSDPEYFRRAWRIPYVLLEEKSWVCVDQSEITDTISSFFKKKYGDIPKIIFFWNTNTLIQLNWKDIQEQNWIKCIYMDDLHQKTNRVLEFRQSVTDTFDYIFCTCAYVFTKFYNLSNPVKLIWFPHSINNNFTVNFNTEPINRITLTGCIDPKIYPFRSHVKEMSKKYAIDVLPQLSYRAPNHCNYGHEYIKYLNKYIASITCCSNSNTPYIVSKFFEIPGSGTLLMAFDQYIKEPLKKLGFEDGINYLSVNFENISSKIEYVLDPKNREHVDNMRRNGYELVWREHTLANRVELLNTILH